MLKKDLAEGKESQTFLARKYGCDQAAVSRFKTENADEIAELRAKVDDAYAGLWIADKKARVAYYQDDVEIVTTLIDNVGTGVRSNKEAAELLRARAAALKAVAEELGDLPVRVKLEGGANPVRHVLEGVDTQDLA
jgi:hypothetical protein